MNGVQSDYRRKSHWRLWLGLFFLILSAVLVRSVWNNFERSQVARKTAEAVQLEHQDLLKRRSELSDQVQALNTERGIEEEIRRNFSVTKDGERVIVVVEPGATDTQATSTSWWQGIFKRD